MRTGGRLNASNAVKVYLEDAPFFPGFLFPFATLGDRQDAFLFPKWLGQLPRASPAELFTKEHMEGLPAYMTAAGDLWDNVSTEISMRPQELLAIQDVTGAVSSSATRVLPAAGALRV